jgi:hypothetical protein
VATVKGNSLVLGYRNANNRKNRVRVYVEMPVLTNIKASGAAKINAAGFETTNFRANASGAARIQLVIVADESKVEASGAAKIKMIGRGNNINANASGAAEIDASEYKVFSANAISSGAAKIWLGAEELNSSTSGAGRIYTQKRMRLSNDTNNLDQNSFRVRIGKYEFTVPTEGWEDIEGRYDDVETLSDVRDRINKTDYIQDRAPRVRHSVNFELGMNNYLQNGRFPEADGAPYSVKPWGSWYVGFNSTHKFHVAGPVFIDWGKGINWYNFKFEDPSIRVTRMEQGIGFIEDPRELPSIKSKITASYLNMSLVPILDFSNGLRRVKSYSMDGFSFTQYNKRGFRIGAGGYAGYRVGAHTKYVYRDDRRQREKERGSFYLNNWRYGVRGQLGYKALDLFFNYDLSPLFVGDASPKLRPFSFGVIF